jgi:hypothetical protein
MMTMNVGMYNGGGGYDPYSLGYEEHPAYPTYEEQYGSSPRSQADRGGYYGQEHYGQEYPQLYTQHPEIIASNGLSYTNLDYGGGYQKQEERGWKQEDPLVQELAGYVAQEYPVAQPPQEYLHHYQPLKEEDSLPHLSNHHHQYDHHHHHQQNQHQQQQQQQSIHHVSQPAQSLPTYKWMQVKRNVPKPAGKNFTYSICNSRTP